MAAEEAERAPRTRGAWGRVTVAAAAGLVAALLGPAALAAPPAGGSSLGWVRQPGAEGCIGARALAEAVEARLGRPVFVSAAVATESLEGRIERERGGAWRAVISVAGADEALSGTRELRSEAASCRDLDAELALVIAVMLDPDAAFRPARANAPAPPTPPVPAVVPHPEPVPAPEPALPRAEPWRGGVEAGVIFSLGLLPGVGTGFTVRGRLTPPGWPALELGGVVWLPGEASASGHGARLSLVEGLVSLCPLATTALGVALSACAGIRVGGIRAGGFGFNLAYAEERPTVAPSIEGGLRRRLVGPLVAGLAAGLVVPLIRDRFYYAEAGGVKLEVFRMSPLAGTLQATVGVELP